MKPNFVLGVDPGAHGAFALLNLSTRKIQMIWDVPTKEGKVHPEGVALVIDMAKSIASAKITAVIENVNSRPGQAHMWAFALGTGIIHGALASFGIPFSLLQPAVWKSGCGLRRLENETQADTKTKARKLAAHLWPERAADFAKAKWDGRAESALIARFFCVKNGWL